MKAQYEIRWTTLAFLVALLCAAVGSARAQTSPLTLRSQWPGYASSKLTVRAASSSDHAYLVGGKAFAILNITDPAQPQVTGHLDSLTDDYYWIDVAHPYACIVGWTPRWGSGALALGVVDVSNPSAPSLRGRCTVAGSSDVNGGQLCVSGTYAYFAGSSFDSGLHVFDLSDPAHPVQVARQDRVTGVDVVGQYAYVTRVYEGGDNPDSRFEVLDMSHPSQPRCVGSCSLFGYNFQVCVAAPYAYVVGYENMNPPGRVHVIDVRDPTHPLRVGGCSTASEARLFSLCLRGGYVFARGDNWLLHTIDVRDPASPVPVGMLEHDLPVGSVSLAGEHLCMAGGTTLRLLDVGQPAEPHLLGDFRFSAPREVCVDQSRAWLRCDNWIEGVDISDPAKPTAAGHFAMPQEERVAALRVSGNRGYVAGKNTTSLSAFLRVLDLTEADNPVQMGAWEVALQSVGEWIGGGGVGENGILVFDNNHAYTLGALWNDPIGRPTSRFLVFDVNNPASPGLIGQYEFDSHHQNHGLAVEGNIACLRSESFGVAGVTVLDISQPENPVFLGQGESPVWGNMLGTVLVGRHAYFADYTSGLRVIDVGDPARPTEVGVFEPGTTATTLTAILDVQVAGRNAIVSGQKGPRDEIWLGRGYLAVLDVADPTQPTLVAEYETKGASAPDIELVGNRLYVANDDWGLAIYDFVAPNISPRLRLNPPVLSGGVLVLTWEGGTGIQLQKTTSLTTPHWLDVPNTEGKSLIALPPSDPAAFFRLIQP